MFDDAQIGDEAVTQPLLHEQHNGTASPLLDADDDAPVDCVASVLVVTIYTRRHRFADHHTATQDVRGVIRTALDRPFAELEAIRLSGPSESDGLELDRRPKGLPHRAPVPGPPHHRGDALDRGNDR